MTFPTPRNAIDATLPAFKKWAYPCDATHQGVDCAITFCGNAQNCIVPLLCQPPNLLFLVLRAPFALFAPCRGHEKTTPDYHNYL